MQRPLDTLLPQAVALLLGLGVLAAVLAGVMADVVLGAPSGASGFGAAVMLPLALFAAIVGFAVGYGAGAWLRKHHLNPSVPLRLYRIVLASALGAATVIGAAAGAMPVIRHERLHRAGLLTDSGGVEKIAQPLQCARPEPAAMACDQARQGTVHALMWNGREVGVACRDRRVTITDGSGAALGSIDLTRFRFVRDVLASAVKAPDGREALVLAARLNPQARRAMLLVLDADARPVYQELVEDRSEGPALAVCRTDEGDTFGFSQPAGVTYRLR